LICGLSKNQVTNTNLGAKEVYEQYSALWQVENAFRVTKGKIALRPMFHFTPKHIEAHVCICFVAYKIYKEFDRVLKLSGINMSVDKVLSIAKTNTTLKIRLSLSKDILTKTMLLTQSHKSIDRLFDENFWLTV
jgi:transposase